MALRGPRQYIRSFWGGTDFVGCVAGRSKYAVCQAANIVMSIVNIIMAITVIANNNNNNILLLLP